MRYEAEQSNRMSIHMEASNDSAAMFIAFGLMRQSGLFVVKVLWRLGPAHPNRVLYKRGLPSFLFS